MSKVTVGSFFTLKEILGGNNQAVEVRAEESTVRGLLSELANRHGDRLKKELFDPKTGEVKFYRIVLNGRHCSDLDTPLKDGDRVEFYPALAGG
jgi:MoaD family protein